MVMSSLSLALNQIRRRRRRPNQNMMIFGGNGLFRKGQIPKSLIHFSLLRNPKIFPVSTTIISECKPYLELMRLEKPIGSWLLFWPGAWSIALACHNQCSSMNWKLLLLFGVGSMVMRGAGCTINDLWDRKIDLKVDRTRGRPLPAGRLNVKQALLFLGGQLSIGLVILLQLNRSCVALGFLSMIPVVIYPLMKRITNWPQLVLGFTFNWGAIMGWTAHVGSLESKVVIPLYLAGICWTLVYDTIYALQDIKDDLLIKVNSTAIYFGEDVKNWLSVFATASTGLLVWVGVMNEMGGIYYSSVVGVAMHYAWQIWTLKKEDVGDCLYKFRSNKWLGAILFGGIMADWMMKKVSHEIVDLLPSTLIF